MGETNLIHWHEGIMARSMGKDSKMAASRCDPLPMIWNNTNGIPRQRQRMDAQCCRLGAAERVSGQNTPRVALNRLLASLYFFFQFFKMNISNEPLLFIHHRLATGNLIL